MLLNEVEEWAWDTGAYGVRLVSGLARTGAHAFYKCCGYNGMKDQKNSRKCFIKNNGRSFVHWTNILIHIRSQNLMIDSIIK